jgi:thymidylate synthase
MREFYYFQDVLNDIHREFKAQAKDVKVGHWQGTTLDLDKLPAFISFELFNYSFAYHVPDNIERMKLQIKPNLPWADEHFGERVSRIPYNPPPSHVRWPFWQASSESTKELGGQKFSHSYPERFWPPQLDGIHYKYGNLDDVINLLVRQPFTRQAYFPIFFPEDTGAVHEGRIPCTLGYQFMRREDELHIFYTIRSCDLFRHFQDDVYFACRLVYWVLEELKKKDRAQWGIVVPGQLIMHIFSLHIFKGEAKKI